MKKRAIASLRANWSTHTYNMAWGGPNPILQVTVGKKSFCLCEIHFVKFQHGIKCGEHKLAWAIPGNWAKNTKFTTQVVNGVCLACDETD